MIYLLIRTVFTTGLSREAQWSLHIVNAALIGRYIIHSHLKTQLLDVTFVGLII